MSKHLDDVIARVKALPEDAQDAIAKVVLSIIDDNGEEEGIDAGHLEGILRGLDEADRGIFATDEEVAAVFAKFDK